MKEVRPTMEKTLQALFNILGSIQGSLEGKAFLDLFSGTGRVASAARDRGASVVTVELLRNRAAAIRADLGGRDHLALCMDVRRALAWLEKRGHRFDVIFADPPYDLRWMAELPGLLGRYREILKPRGLVVLESSRDEALDLDGSPWELVDRRRYGISALSFLVLCQEGAAGAKAELEAESKRGEDWRREGPTGGLSGIL